MGDAHSYSFFGQKTGLILQSRSKEDPFIFIQCIKDKENGSWEKPTQGEGKVIKCNLEEIVMILQVLEKKVESWTTYHSFKEEKTQISFHWEKNNNTKLWINIGEYNKSLDFSQSEIFRRLLEHILQEKIEFATTVSKKETNGTYIVETQEGIPQNNKDKKETTKISGIIKGASPKALLIEFNNGKEIWVPKSTIESKYNEDQKDSQLFTIHTWILTKNNIIPETID